MCGIHLLWGKDATAENIQVLVEAGRERGPDHEAFFSPWLGMWVGVNRLRISDPSAVADQPFWSEDGHAFLIWNGELYNSEELKALLTTMGLEFKTHSDTEVLLLWLRSFGKKGLARLKGMFSLILVNVINKSILVARDPNGEKPLFYKQSPDTLCISSSAEGTAKVSNASLDSSSFLTYAYLRAPRQGHSFYKGVKEWKPNRYSMIKNHLTFRFDPLPEPKVKDDSKGQNLELFEGKLNQAVRRQFQADVPVGMLLSGGADSSLLYASWYQQTGIKLPSFTIEVDKKYQNKYQDAHFSKSFAEKFPTDLTSVSVSEEIFLKHWDEYLVGLDQPVGDSAGFLLWLVGKQAKAKGIKVLISGAGADELWGGYRRHDAFQKFLKNKSWLLRLKPFAQHLPLPREYAKFFKSLRINEDHTFLNFSGLRPVPKEIFQDYERVFEQKLSSYKRALDFDRKVYLVEDLLKIQDQSLMAHGIEGRSPYLDRDLIALWENVKAVEILSKKKWIHGLLKNYGLEEISNRNKLGLGLPLLEWLEENGPFAKRVFSSLKRFGLSYQEELNQEIFELTQDPEHFIKTDFLMLYNLFLLAEWVILRKA